MSRLCEEEDDSALQVTMGAFTVALGEQSNRKTDLVTDAQDAAVRAQMSGGAGFVRLLKQAQATRDRIIEFCNDYEQDPTRLAQAQISLSAKIQAVEDQRGKIVRRLKTMSSLAVRVEVEFGIEIIEKEAQFRQPQHQIAPRLMRRRPRRVRVHRLRAS